MAAESEWLRVRGIGRERFAGNLADYLTGIGYTVERTRVDRTARRASLVAQLTRMNPAVPEERARAALPPLPDQRRRRGRLGGAAEVPGADRRRLDRMVREIYGRTSSARSSRRATRRRRSPPPQARLPWGPAP